MLQEGTEKQFKMPVQTLFPFIPQYTQTEPKFARIQGQSLQFLQRLAWFSSSSSPHPYSVGTLLLPSDAKADGAARVGAGQSVLLKCGLTRGQ